MPNGAGGGGGGGIVGVSNSFTGAAQTLEVVGDHAYAISGTFDSIVATQTLLKFTSGNFYLVGELTMTGGVQFVSAGIPNGTLNAFELSFNGSAIAVYKTDTNDEDSPTNYVVPILIPAYTDVQLDMMANADNTGDLATASIHGRIYRG